MDAEEVPLRVALMGLILGGCASQALRTMVILDLADHLAHGPRDIDDLAEAAEVDAGALRRLITVVTALGLCERIDGSAAVALTPLGSLLRSDAPGPFKALTSVMTAPWINRAWEELPDAIGTGKSVFEQAHLRRRPCPTPRAACCRARRAGVAQPDQMFVDVHRHAHRTRSLLAPQTEPRCTE